MKNHKLQVVNYIPRRKNGSPHLPTGLAHLLELTSWTEEGGLCPMASSSRDLTRSMYLLGFFRMNKMEIPRLVAHGLGPPHWLILRPARIADSPLLLPLC